MGDRKCLERLQRLLKAEEARAWMEREGKMFKRPAVAKYHDENAGALRSVIAALIAENMETRHDG